MERLYANKDPGTVGYVYKCENKLWHSGVNVGGVPRQMLVGCPPDISGVPRETLVGCPAGH